MSQSLLSVGILLILAVLLSAALAASPSNSGTLTLNKASYIFGEDMTVTFTRTAGTATVLDWVGLYPNGITPDGSPAATSWNYLCGSQNACGTPKTSGTLVFTLNVGVGNWKFWYLHNDGYSQLGSVVFAVTAAPPVPVPPGVTIEVGNFNVLAPCWASPNYYPSGATSLLTPYATRINRGISYMTGALGEVDFWSFQETETIINDQLANGYGTAQYNWFHVFHDDNYWDNWITPDPVFHRNGVSIGVNKNKYDQCVFVDKPLGTGNHAGIAICRNIQLNRWLRFCAVHFDSDDSTFRNTESAALNAYLASENSHTNYVDIIAGDLNSNTDSGPMYNNLIQNGFTDALSALGVTLSTAPGGSGSNIDHILVRVSNEGWTPITGVVHNNNLFQLYPEVTGGQGTKNRNNRIIKNFEFTGSDHFPVSATFIVHT